MIRQQFQLSRFTIALLAGFTLLVGAEVSAQPPRDRDGSAERQGRDRLIHRDLSLIHI